MPITLTEQLACAQREARLRKNCYGRFVLAGRMTEETARHELEAMAAVVATLAALVAHEQEQAGQLALLPTEVL